MGRWGFFITFEGVEGCGKSTLATALKNFLESEGFKVIFTREPGGTPTAEAVRNVLLNKEFKIDPWSEVFLLLAARRENMVKVIYPALTQGFVVISDRFDDSTFAYQCYGRGLPYKIVARFNKFATMRIKPNLTFLIDIPVEVGLKRVRGELDRMESESVEFHRRVREGYLKLAHRAKKRIHVMDGTKPIDELIEEVKKVTLQRLSEKSLGRFKRKG